MLPAVRPSPGSGRTGCYADSMPSAGRPSLRARRAHCGADGMPSAGLPLLRFGGAPYSTPATETLKGHNPREAT